MCLILDNSARDNVFSRHSGTPVGRQLLEWLDEFRTSLVVGGKLYDELAGSRVFKVWAANAIKDGRLRFVRRDVVDRETTDLKNDWRGKSDDEHVIALARVSRARVLHAHDSGLRDDFRNPALVSNPRGKLYPLRKSPAATKRRRALLNRTDLCPNA